MSTGSYASASPPSSGEIPMADTDRYDDVEHKHKRVSQFLQTQDYNGLILKQPANFAWFTAGGNCPQISPGETIAALFISNDARVVVSNNVDSGDLFDRQLAGLGFLLKERPWHEDRHVLLDDLCRGRKMASDSGNGSTTNEAARIAGLRLPLSPFECSRMQLLGAQVAHALEATARHIELKQTEAEIAGQIANRLIKHEVLPSRIQVIADGRGKMYRHYTYSDRKLERWCVLSVVGQRWGLHCAATRTVCWGNPFSDVEAAHQQALMLEGTGIYFSQVGSQLGTTWDKVQRIYEKIGHPNEWQLCDQADVIGYQACEVPVAPRSEFCLSAGMALHWHPSVGPVQVGDTVLVGEEGVLSLTPPLDWPTRLISVKGHMFKLPDMLIREAPNRA